MGSSISRVGSDPPRRTGSRQRRWPKVKRSISSLLVCGSSSSSRSPNEMEDYPADLLVNSAEHGHEEKLKFPRSDSDLSLSSRTDLISIKTENGASSGRFIASREGVGPSNVESGGSKGKCLSDSRELVPSLQSFTNSKTNEAGSTSYLDQPYQARVSANEIASMDSLNRINNTYRYSSQVGLEESLSDEVSVENNVSETIDVDSLVDSHSLRDDNLQENGSLLQVDVVGISSNSLSGNSAEMSSGDVEIVRRNSRRLFWDAFSSRRSSRRHTESRTFVFSPDDSDSDNLRSQDRWLLDFSGDFFNGGSSTQTTACPRGIHTNGPCLCQSSLLAEESGPRGGISRIVMLAEALFEVLDQIHRQPMSLSLSMVSLPAPESVVDSFPVKTHRKTERLERADDISQCYICLSEYEEGDKIRVLPCHHEYHMSCVDRWLKEIHGVCPLCRGDVREGLSEGSVSN
ncbi:hypothetical protein ACJIZ3_020589 [Penstemon smallii]|uniref:RING-type domain-containing protein n=1 Tax=Penstemon smallii TaxID=265156 RepID=A0ABD3SJM6_9LAMI